MPATTVKTPGATHTQQWLARAARVTTGPQSNLRAASGESPLVLERGQGLRLYDVDGKEYIDLNLGMGPGLWGHGNPRWIEAVQKQLQTLIYIPSGVAQSKLEIQVAEKICAHVPSAQSVRFCTTGSEAVQLALRIGRAYTGRPNFVRFESGYHGWLDNVYGGVVNPDPDAAPFAMESEDDGFKTLGRYPDSFSESFKLPWNDAEVLEKTLKTHGREIAMVLTEPIMCNGGCLPPKPGFLERVRELCDEYRVLLCFDEIITGFRVALGGAQAELGVTPDLTTFGKALTGGMPLSAIAGKNAVLDLVRGNKVTSAGTFNACPPSMAASLATLEMLEEDNGAYYGRTDRQQVKIMTALRASAARHKHKLLVQGPRGVFFTEFVDRDAAHCAADLRGASPDKSRRLRLLLLEEGVLIGRGNRWFISGNLTNDDVDGVIERVDRALARL